jgi:shikimate dehydrogenase
MTTITAKTHVCGILGHPVGHSLSPALHNAAFAARGLDFVYVAHDVAVAELPAAIAGARALGYRGLSITIPHKVAAMALVDEVDPTALGIGCINTIVNTGGRLRGFNSDGRGALEALRAAGADPTGRRVVVVGSGGAARAIAMTLALEAPPEQLRVLGVVPEELSRLVADLNARRPGGARALPMDEATLTATLVDADLLLNCTPIGMHPHTDASPVPRSLLRRGLTVFDAVYNPRRTRLLADAAEAGATVVEGLAMFLGQAVVQFELFTGEPAPVDVMRAVLEERL